MRIETEYLRVIKERFQSVKSLGDNAIEQLVEDDIHWALNEESNSVAVIVSHLSGNMISRWTDFLNSDGEKPYRNREQEFVDNISSKAELIAILEIGWNTLFEALNNLSEEDLLKVVFIRGQSHSVIEAIERQLAHYAYHIGQIVYIGKQIKSENWESLSIPIGQSESYLQQMLKKHQSE
ncbi:hypothetical protein CSE16_07590 [Solibacillus sp. R5-41]|uniref:DUF1572 family protein n=1 Tax=Solibacillus sp. R5-41 TaxID=2048654 RepID=UPI000C129235|nr:DUF1572 family protein [Solibacillus sp. R5-41]ATP39924.1 hypothetical protein CSE16_07590 [Solibacillus sp. R5-41]